MEDLLRGERDLNKIVWKFPLRLGFLRPSYVKRSLTEILWNFAGMNKTLLSLLLPLILVLLLSLLPPKKWFSNTVHRHIRGKRGTVSATKAERAYRSMAKETRKWKFYSNSNYIFRVQRERERKRTETVHFVARDRIFIAFHSSFSTLTLWSFFRNIAGGLVGSLVEDCFGNR